MQTFIPYKSYEEIANALDRQRLGKQRVEAYQILKVLYAKKRGVVKGAWFNHPAVKMWEGYEGALCEYAIAICNKWISLGYKDTLKERFEVGLLFSKSTNKPNWWGRDDIHTSHQSNLIKKKPDYYRDMFKGVSGDLPYIWAV